MSLPLTTNTSTTTLGFKLQVKTPPSASKRPSNTSCQLQNGSADKKHHVVDRRNILIGLTGVCGASTTLGNVAVGAPIKPVDLGKCHKAVDENLIGGPGEVECCPPDFSGMPIKDFKVLKGPQVLRMRAAAHLLTDEYIAKYKEAIAKMKALPDSDPWSFYQQAQIHCQYCNGAYDQVGVKNPITLQVHNGWFFGPWHRFYLHFWEKILGKLIGDPTFAVPYWNWDTPKGMFMPDIYKDPLSPLHNKNRNKDHYSTILDLKYARGAPNPPNSEYKNIIINNLQDIERRFTEGLRNPSLFMGNVVRAGEPPNNDVGTLETLHNVHHAWVGPVEQPNWDMGNFHTAGRDTLFWAHHANVDRMWHLFSGRRSNKREFKDNDWLDSSFIFYDENRELVKCKVRDSLRIENFGYTYTQEPLPWLSIKKEFRKLRKAKKRSAGGDDSVTQVAEFGSKTRALDTTIRALVKRPKVNLTLDDKEDVSEVLIVDDITINDNTDQIRFDVYIAKPNEGLVSADLGEFAGSYFNIPHSLMNKMKNAKTVLRLGITGLVGEIEADSSENLVVSLVPGSGKVTIGGVKIDLVPNPEPDDDDDL